MTKQTLETRQVSRRELLSLFGAGTLAAMGISIAGPTLAEMSDGSFAMGKAEVKVTIGGCGG